MESSFLHQARLPGRARAAGRRAASSVTPVRAVAPGMAPPPSQLGRGRHVAAQGRRRLRSPSDGHPQPPPGVAVVDQPVLRDTLTTACSTTWTQACSSVRPRCKRSPVREQAVNWSCLFHNNRGSEANPQPPVQHARENGRERQACCQHIPRSCPSSKADLLGRLRAHHARRNLPLPGDTSAPLLEDRPMLPQYAFDEARLAPKNRKLPNEEGRKVRSGAVAQSFFRFFFFHGPFCAQRSALPVYYATTRTRLRRSAFSRRPQPFTNPPQPEPRKPQQSGSRLPPLRGLECP